MSASDPMEIEARAADWIAARSDRANWNDSNQAKLDAWLAESPAHEVAHLRLQAIWNSADRLAVLRNAEREQAEPQAQRPRVAYARIVAGMTVAAALGIAGYIYLSLPRQQTYATAIGKHETVALADGSSIELNTDTVLRTGVGRGQRTVTLIKGEAYFQIKHDAAHPFTVRFGDHRITDLGTKFLLRGDSNRLEMALLEGSARIDSTTAARPAQSAVLEPGDVAVATVGAVSISRKSTRELANELAWRNGVIVFHDTALADVVAEFNRYDTDRIVIADAAAGRRHVGGTFSTRDVRQFVIVVRDVLGLHVENRGHEIVISR